MKKEYRVGWRTKAIYTAMVLLFASVLFVMSYVFERSRELLIEQEAGIISQYMNRNELAMMEAMDSIRKLSAASSTNKQVSALLNQSCEGSIYSAENASRIRAVEDTLTFYRNIFFNYRIHYIILGADGTVYSIADGIDNSSYFGQQFSDSVKGQDWYQAFLDSNAVSRWIAPCSYNEKGVFQTAGEESGYEDFILFVRKITDYNSLKFLGVSFVSFPVENLEQILIPYKGGSMALFNRNGDAIYLYDEAGILESFSMDQAAGRFEEGKGYFHYSDQAQEYLLNYATMEGSGWKLVNIVPVSQITRAVDRLYGTVTMVTIFIILGAVAVCLAMYVYVNAPLNRLLRRVSGVNIGGRKISDVGGEARPVFGISEAEQQINHMVAYIEDLSAQALKQKEIEENLRYEMLRAQLNPHFLFNTLNVIKWSAMISGAGNIGDMITSLGILLEHTMNRGDEESTLQEEIRVVKAWVEIKNWALKNRIEVHEEVPEELKQFRVIRFFMQPIVENTVLHGLKDRDKGEIWIKAERAEGCVQVAIQDDGIGIQPEKLKKILEELDAEHKHRHVTGIGLASIHELMRVKYGAEYGLRIESEVGVGTKIVAVFPDREDEGHVEGNDSR